MLGDAQLTAEQLLSEKALLRVVQKTKNVEREKPEGYESYNAAYKQRRGNGGRDEGKWRTVETNLE